MRFYRYNDEYELLDDEPNIFANEIVWINNKEYRIVKQESWEFSSRNIGTHFDTIDEIISYVRDSNGRLFITTLPNDRVLFPIHNTEHISGFEFNYHREDNEKANRTSLVKASNGNFRQYPHYQVDVRFRGSYWFDFVDMHLTFSVVYCACKYFFDSLYPEGYGRRDISFPVDFEAGAFALNYIKRLFGKKGSRKYVSESYCIKHYAYQRDWEWSNEWERKYGLNPLEEVLRG